MPRRAKPRARRLRTCALPHAEYGIDLDKVPDTYIEPFTAYRAWNWDALGITSLNNARWKPKVAFEATTAQCGENHPVPSPDCSCGMYAGINMAHLISIGYIERGIHGEVSLWGRLYRHTLGWRAQFAYPKFFIIPANMIPFDMGEAQNRLKTLIEFDVDIYLQPKRDAEVGQENIPLWIRDYGYSAQGLSYLVDKRQRWYSGEGRIAPPPLVKGDRLAIFATSVNGSGIGVVTDVVGEELYYTLFSPNVVYHKNVKDIKWNEKNWRWETTGVGWRRAGR